MLRDSTVTYADIVAEHRVWLQRFDKQRVKKWDDLLKANSEAAICEAMTRKFFSDHDIDVQPYEDLSGGGPDFLCFKNDKDFYVEVTCITKEAATKETCLNDVPQESSHAHYYRLLTQKIFYELCNKTPQCSSLGNPCVVAMCTLHFQASCLCLDRKAAEFLLTGTPKIAWKIDVSRGEAVGNSYQSTDLQDSLYIRPDKNEISSIEEARRVISGVLLCPFGAYPQKFLGILHPNPNHAFDRTLLPEIKFCRLADGYQTGRLSVEWI